MFSVGVIIPAYNEEKNIANTIKAVKNIPYIKNIVVVDDGSTDDTARIAHEEKTTVLRLPHNHGKSYAICRGLEVIYEPTILFLDADIGNSAVEAIKLIKPILNNNADVTIAKFPNARRRGGFGLVKGLARGGIWVFTGKKCDSVLSGQRCFKRDILNTEICKYPRYGIEFGMTIDLLNVGARILEIDVNMTHRETGRNLEGFYHRGRQFCDICNVMIKKAIER